MRRRKVKRKKKNRSFSSKGKHNSNCCWGTKVTNTLAPGVSQEIGGSVTGAGKAYSNRRNGKDKYSDSPESPTRTRRERRGNEEESIYDGYR